MGRGISELQRWILVLCLDRNFISSRELLCAWLDLEPAAWGSKRTSIGERQYNSAHASLSRTISRLWQRGLVVIWKTLTNSATGITLTEEGKVVAQAISEEEAEDAP